MKYSSPAIVVVAEDVLGQLKHVHLHRFHGHEVYQLSNKFNTPHQFLFTSQTLLVLRALDIGVYHGDKGFS